MICRRCGNRIPENLAARESFRCPNCGRQFGTPVQEERPSFNFDEPPRRSRFVEDDVRDSEPVRASGSRFADPADAYYDDQPDDNYYDEQAYADDDGYYDEQAYDDGDLSDFAASGEQPAPGMKLTTIICALILEVTALIAVFGISLFL